MRYRFLYGGLFLSLLCLVSACRENSALTSRAAQPQPTPQVNLSPTVKRVINSAKTQTDVTRSYDPAYVVLAYPLGDVPRDRGVCTDVVIRAFRDGAKVDLQKEVHEDMTRAFAEYPRRWGLKQPDKNIDHRRVPNLMTYFARRKKSLPVSDKARDYQPGDVVTWDLDGEGLAHIGLVTDEWSAASGRYKIAHNIGRGTNIEDVLFDWEITGHYRYFD